MSGIPKTIHVPHGCSHLIYDHPADGSCVAEILIDNSAAGKEMCRRWNLHDELVEALERAVSVIEDLPYPQNHPVEEMRLVLAKAKEIK